MLSIKTGAMPGVNPDYRSARDLLLALALPVDMERIPLSEAAGRVLARDLTAEESIPPFDASPYDGYAFCAADAEQASREMPVKLRILEEIPAGAVPSVSLTRGTAVKILTGAPLPAGADVVVPFERTEFTQDAVTIFQAAKSGENIVRAGEDVLAGQKLAAAGSIIDAGLAGCLASQGRANVEVFRRPVVGIISTGNEVVEAHETPAPGKIRNSNRHTLETVLWGAGCLPRNLGLAADRAEEICRYIEEGLISCDALLITGGVSVGDYDMTPAAMEMAQVRMLVRGVRLKPGMACAYGEKSGKLICGLSGNPASALTNLYAVVLPAIKKLAGRQNPVPDEFPMILASGFPKKSPVTRLLRGRLNLSEGRALFMLPQEQGNGILSSTIGCNAMAIIPGGSGPVAAGTLLSGFLL